MEKLLTALLAASLMGSACFGMGTAPPSKHTDQPSMIVTGEVESVRLMYLKGLEVQLLDDNKRETTVFFLVGTTPDWPAPEKKRLEVVYFKADDGKNVALRVTEIGTKE